MSGLYQSICTLMPHQTEFNVSLAFRLIDMTSAHRCDHSPTAIQQFVAYEVCRVTLSPCAKGIPSRPGYAFKCKRKHFDDTTKHSAGLCAMRLCVCVCASPSFAFPQSTTSCV